MSQKNGHEFSDILDWLCVGFGLGRPACLVPRAMAWHGMAKGMAMATATAMATTMAIHKVDLSLGVAMFMFLTASPSEMSRTLHGAACAPHH